MPQVRQQAFLGCVHTICLGRQSHPPQGMQTLRPADHHLGASDRPINHTSDSPFLCYASHLETMTCGTNLAMFLSKHESLSLRLILQIDVCRYAG